jgi:hypothetical protein
MAIKIHPGHILTVLRVNGAPPEECLKYALKRVDKGILDAVHSALYDAKVEKVLGEMEGRQIDFVREFEKHREPASTALKELKNYMITIGASAARPISWLDDPIRALDKMDLHTSLHIPRRRKKEGRHHQPWINKARRKLRRLGVPVELSEELLLATGIRRPRSNES